MRILFILLLSISILSFQCSKDQLNIPDSDCLKGKLIVSGPCKNLIIKIINGSYDPSKVESKWTDPMTNLVHENVFTVKNVCSFPDSIKELDEFYFYFVKNPENSDCAVCLIYRPTPSTSNYIIISEKPCN